MDNYKAENQEQEIDLVSLFFAVAHRYKQMAAAAVICAVLFGGFGVVKGMLNQRAIDEAIANGEEVPRTSAEQQYEEDMVEYREAQTKHDTDVTSYKQQLNQNEADQVRAQFDIDNAQAFPPTASLPFIRRPCKPSAAWIFGPCTGIFAGPVCAPLW